MSRFAKPFIFHRYYFLAFDKCIIEVERPILRSYFLKPNALYKHYYMHALMSHIYLAITQANATATTLNTKYA